MRKYAAELIGTFALVFAGTGAVVINDVTGGAVTHVGVAVTFGLIVMAMIYAVGDVSGAHLNPAVTLGFWTAGRLPGRCVVPYVLSQLAGAVLASVLLRAMFGNRAYLGATLPAGTHIQSFALEAVLTGILMFVILCVSTGPKETGVMAGIAVGGVVGLEAMFAGPISGASMNPARSLAPALVSGHLASAWVYVAGPLAGALLAVPCWLVTRSRSAAGAELQTASESNRGDDAMSEQIVDQVRSKYGAVAGSGLSSDNDGVRAVAEAFGYSPDELGAIPAEANMGLSCGNPIALANLRPGEVVVDLGSGGGLDVFLAAQKVGPAGKAIGIDMTPQMIDLARKNAARGVKGQPFTNVEFYLSSIDRLPLPDASVDVVISNCVINLAPDKPAVFREIARVLKPGGRLAVSDIALKQPLPPEIAQDVMAYVGCIAGATLIDEYSRQLTEAGFAHVQVVDSGADLNAYAQVEGQSGCCSPPQSTSSTGLPIASNPSSCSPEGSVHNGLAQLLGRYDVNEYAASVKVYAVKPRH